MIVQESFSPCLMQFELSSVLCSVMPRVDTVEVGLQKKQRREGGRGTERVGGGEGRWEKLLLQWTLGTFFIIVGLIY